MCVDVAAICGHPPRSRFVHFKVGRATQIACTSALLYLGKRKAAELAFACKHLESRLTLKRFAFLGVRSCDKSTPWLQLQGTLGAQW